MTNKLYENDSYIKEFSAVVTSCEANGDRYEVKLDTTAFFPEEGGQPSDTGSIDGITVLDVQLRGGDIIHILDNPVEVGKNVFGIINWERRFPYMQNHSGEHIVSGLIHNRYGYTNVGFHLDDISVTLDVDGKLTDAQMVEIEDEANRVIWENHSITVSYPDKEEIARLDYRSKLELTENVRLVTIDNCDCCACCAPHVSRTGEVGLLKILNHFPHRGGTRIELVCGEYALRDYRMLHHSNSEIMRCLSSKRAETPESVLKLSEALSSAKSEIKKLHQDLVLSSAEYLKIGSIPCCFVKNAQFDELRLCMNDMQKSETEYCFAFGEISENSFLFAAGSRNTDIRVLINSLRQSLPCGGGGNEHFAQGKISASREKIENALSTLL